MSDGTPFLRVTADRIGAPGSARIAGKNAIPRHHRRQLVLNHPDRREDGRHSKANRTSSRFESHSTGWEGSIWGIPVNVRPGWTAELDCDRDENSVLEPKRGAVAVVDGGGGIARQQTVADE